MPEPVRAASRIFISYRRDDTAYAAGWLFDRLVDEFGPEQVFKDMDSIALGDDFVDAITAAVSSTDVLLALIGDKWLGMVDEHGERRLDDPDDFVRLEIEAALERDVRVIPILVEGARMPRSEELPQSVAALARRQALELTSSRFSSDTRTLLSVLEKTLLGAARTHDAAPTARSAKTDATDQEKTPSRREAQDAGRTPSAPPQPVDEPTSRPRPKPALRQRLATVRRRPHMAVAAAVVAAGGIALGAVLLNNTPESPSREPGRQTTESPSLESGRQATRAVYEAWQANKLKTLSESRISTPARRALRQMPIEPPPNEPGADDCYGDPDDVDCAYYYPSQDFYLAFRALRYPSGFKVTNIRCVDPDTNDDLGRIAICADMIKSS
jgi:TIR domain